MFREVRRMLISAKAHVNLHEKYWLKFSDLYRSAHKSLARPDWRSN